MSSIVSPLHKLWFSVLIADVLEICDDDVIPIFPTGRVTGLQAVPSEEMKNGLFPTGTEESGVPLISIRPLVSNTLTLSSITKDSFIDKSLTARGAPGVCCVINIVPLAVLYDAVNTVLPSPFK